MQQTHSPKAVAVLRDTSTGQCVLVETGTVENLDVERVSESWLELAGWLFDGSQYSPGTPSADDCKCEDDENPTPCFTYCEYDLEPWAFKADESNKCGRMIMLIDDGAPEYCTKHQDDEV